MKRVLHKGDYYIERRLDSYNIYRILEDTDDLSGVKCERIWIRPESIYNFGETQVYMMDIDYRDYYRQISLGLATLIKDECEAFERTIKLMLENVLLFSIATLVSSSPGSTILKRSLREKV